MDKLDEDIKTMARHIIQSNEKRKKRIKNNRASEFDIMAADAIKTSLCASCGNIESIQVREKMQEQIYRSIVSNIPYEHLDVLCGRRQFYEYRTEFITKVANGMKMLPTKKNGSS